MKKCKLCNRNKITLKNYIYGLGMCSNCSHIKKGHPKYEAKINYLFTILCYPNRPTG